jgi:IS30 family transposase
MGRNPGTISRELRRNMPPIDRGIYRPHLAQDRAATMWLHVGRPRGVKSRWAKWYIKRQLARRWSPELVAGRMALLRPNLAVSHETIYTWIYRDAPELIRWLPRHHRTRKVRGHSRRREIRISGRIPIARRPHVANDRRRLGDWEADTMVTWRGQSALQIVVDRKSRYTLLNFLTGRTAKAMRVTLNRALGHLPRTLRHTITYDNGHENAQHQRVNASLGTRSYFCRPYASQERGTVENTAGLVRRFFPKRTDFNTIDSSKIKKVERWLNHRPRVILNFRTPAELFHRGVALQP